MAPSGLANATVNTTCSSVASACKRTQAVLERQVHAKGRQPISPADAGGGPLDDCSDE